MTIGVLLFPVALLWSANTVGRVPRAPVEKERRVTGSCVLGAGHVGKERERSVGRVPVAVCIGLERRITVGRIRGAEREAEEGIVTHGGVFSGIPLHLAAA